MKPEIIYTKHIKGILSEFVRNLFGKCSRTGTIILLCIALIAIILAVYMQVGNHQFFIFDDLDHVTNNPHIEGGITGKNIIWAFTSVDAYNWHPITWLSHMTIAHFYGMNPRAHHLVNVAIHAVSALLLFFLLLRLTGTLWNSLFVAALFALHPLHVESVAWVAERKDVLSAFFWFLTLLLYAEYVEKQKPALYILTLFSFVLGLMSKPMIVTLPIVMLLIDFWPLDRYRYGEQELKLRQILGRVITLIKEKIPFFVCSLLSGVITIYAQHKGGVMQGLKEISFQLRFENALIAYVKYIGKTLWPHDLAFLYPFPLSIPLWQVISSLLILLLLSAAAIRSMRSHPHFTVGWFWFLITLVPVIGLIQVGAQSMADRYSYIPVIGLFIIAAWGVPDLTKSMKHRQGILALLAGAVLIVSAALTWQQLDYWRDSISLLRHTLQVTTDNAEINYNLGRTLQAKGYLDEAIQQYQEALRINPNNVDAHNNMGGAFQTKGDLDAAIKEYQEALRITPNNFSAHYNLGLALQSKGDLDAAIKEFREALRIDPNNSDVHNNLGVALASRGDLDAANQEYQQALRLRTSKVTRHEK